MQMDEGARLWLFKTAHKNYWRVAPYYELDDLIQDGFVSYYKTVARYKRRVKNRSHMMRLFQMSYVNHIHDLAKLRTRHNRVIANDLVTGDADPLNALAANCSDDTHQLVVFMAALAKAPTQVKQVLLILTTHQGRMELCKPYRGKANRETSNERLCRLTGYDPEKTDLVAAVKNYFAVATA